MAPGGNQAKRYSPVTSSTKTIYCHHLHHHVMNYCSGNFLCVTLLNKRVVPISKTKSMNGLYSEIYLIITNRCIFM